MQIWLCPTFVFIWAASIFMLGRKWQLKSRHLVPWLIVTTAFGCAALVSVTMQWPDVPWWAALGFSLGVCYALSLAVMLYCFFRDPERHVPNDDRQVVSPADGTIVYVKPFEDGRFPFAVKGNRKIPLSEFSDVEFAPERGLQIGIAMNFLNVHVNRSPIAGTVKLLRRVPGRFASLKHIASLLENERVLLVVEGDDLCVGMVQIASRLVRRIVPYVRVGQHVAQGQRVGMIRFGSQVDVLIPAQPGLQVVANVGDEVTAGQSVLVVRRATDPQEPRPNDAREMDAELATHGR